MTTLGERQAELARALVAGGATPPGFDAEDLTAAREALLRKRAGEVAHHWPALLHGRAERAAFVEWARGRPKTSSCADGRAFAEHLEALGELPAHACRELAEARGGDVSRWRPRGPLRGRPWRSRPTD